ncbi:MAG: sodium:solute symporter [Oligosphaeraceae bacterium]
MMWLDWVIVALPLIAVVVIGFIAEHYVRSVSDFLAAGRRAGRYLLTVSEGTAGMGLISVVAMFEQKYKAGYGLDFWGGLTSLIYLAMTLTGFVTYRFRETRAMTMPEFFQKRYSRGFRILAGLLAFISGVINYALFPAVGGRFLIYYCGLPFTLHLFGLEISTYGLVMAVALAVALAIVLAGGQLTTMITDCCQGIFAYFGYAVITITLLWLFSAQDMADAVLSRPDGESFFNPFNIGHLSDFNILFVIISIVGAVYARNAWLGAQGYMASASSPHEQKMAGVLASWRTGFLNISLMLLVIGAYTYMNSKTWESGQKAVMEELTLRTAQDFHLEEKEQRTQALFRGEDASAGETAAFEAARTELIQAQNTARTIGTQMLVPVALRHILPIGVTGIFCALMIFLMVSTDTTYLHSWGTIFIQDVVLPIRNKPITARAQMNLLRWAILGIAVFSWFFSYYFQQGDYIMQFFALTGTIFLGGAGSCIIGGLYWRKGTTAGAYTAMMVGCFFAILGFFLNQQWATLVYPWFSQNHPAFLEGFRVTLENLGNALPIVQWNTSPQDFASKFPITGQEIYFLGILFSVGSYVAVSLLTCRQPYNLDALLHRGEYNLEHKVPQEGETPSLKKGFSLSMLAGITPEYSRGDRILAWSVLIYSLYGFLVYLIQMLLNAFPATRWSEETWVKFFLYYTLPLSLAIGVVTTIWFTWGTIRDLGRLFRALKENYDKGGALPDDNQDNGQLLTK